MSNYVELCRIVEYRRTRRTLSNYVELCRTLSFGRILSNSSNFVELCRTLSNFVESGCGGGPPIVAGLKT